MDHLHLVSEMQSTGSCEYPGGWCLRFNRRGGRGGIKLFPFITPPYILTPNSLRDPGSLAAFFILEKQKGKHSGENPQSCCITASGIDFFMAATGGWNDKPREGGVSVWPLVSPGPLTADPPRWQRELTPAETPTCVSQVGLEAIQNTRCDPKGRFHDCMRGFIVHCDIFSFWFHPLLLTIEPSLPQLPSLGLWYHTSSSSTFLLSSRQNCDIASNSDVCSV